MPEDLLAMGDSAQASGDSDDELDDDDDDEMPPFTPPKFNLLSKLKVMFARDVQTEKEKALEIASEEWASILTQWRTARYAKRTRILWRGGIPPNLRKEVWTRAVPTDPTIDFEAVMQAVQTDRDIRAANGINSETTRLISLDVPRTYPSLEMFQKDCSLSQPLQDVLEAVAKHNPSLGYCQGMSYLAATLLMYMDTRSTFIVILPLVQHPLLSALYAMNVPAVVQHLRIYEVLLAKHLPRVFENFSNLGITSDQYVMEWLMTLFSRALPLEVCHRIWDCFIMEGELFLFRAAIGILKLDQQQLETGTFDICVSLVKSFKEVDGDRLFKKIFSVSVPKYLNVFAGRLRNGLVQPGERLV